MSRVFYFILNVIVFSVLAYINNWKMTEIKFWISLICLLFLIAIDKMESNK